MDSIKKAINDNKMEKAVYIGDTKIDLEATYANNIPFVQAKYGFGENLNTDYSINEIKELLDVLKKIFKD